jgi:hypothetical protein
MDKALGLLPRTTKKKKKKERKKEKEGTMPGPTAHLP